jgi:two-component system, OmpR family, sensor histidine kinase ChvG
VLHVRRTAGLGIGSKLVLFSLVLLAMPWLGYRYIQDMRAFLLQGQEQAQMLAAQAVATVLHEREDLFGPGTGAPESLAEAGSLYAYPLATAIQVDGYTSDWESLLPRGVRYHAVDGDLAFDLVLGAREAHVYALVRVHDPHVVYRHPAHRRLDAGDHLRLTLRGADGQPERLLVTTDGEGPTVAYRVDPTWRTALAPWPVYEVDGHWRERRDGYDVELRLPITLLGPTRELRIEVADVNDPTRRRVERIAASLPSHWDNELNPVIVRSAELERLLRGLERAAARVWVVDRHRRVRGVAGEFPDDETDLMDRLDGPLVRSAVSGRAGIERRPSPSGPGETIIAAQPLHSSAGVIGAVIMEQNTEEILSLQRETFTRIALATLLVLALSVAGLVLFAYRLAWRIRRLRDEAAAAIDASGRVLAVHLHAERDTKDDLGGLSRSISGMLTRLQRYTRFLESIPRTLRHEINNPLNVISTSLQNLADEQGAPTSRYIESAERGVARLGRIMQRLTEAASLEDALRHDEHRSFDLAALLSGYVESCAELHPQRQFEYQGPCSGVSIEGADARIEQMLDKLIDNAVDFTPPGGAIRVGLEQGDGWVRVGIANDGRPLPQRLHGQLFDSLVSVREPAGGEQPHLGLGLYVVRIIAEHHGGRLEAADRENGDGAVFTIHLPAPRPHQSSV